MQQKKAYKRLRARSALGVFVGWALLFGLIALAPRVQAAPTTVVYSKGFQNGWNNPGPGAGTYSFANGAPIRLDFGGYNYAKMTHEPVKSQQFLKFTLKVLNGFDPKQQNWYVQLDADRDAANPKRGRFTLDFSQAKLNASGAYQFEVDVRSGNLAGGLVDSIIFQAGTLSGPGLAAGTIGQLDDIEFDGPTVEVLPFARVGASRAPTISSASASIDCRASRNPISSRIYGVAMYSSVFKPSAPESATIGSQSRRWGGNRTSRYNAALPGANTGNDYFFQNTPEPISVEKFIANSTAAGQGNAVTIPALNWIAKDTSSYSYPVSAFSSGQGPAGADPFNPDRTNGLVAGSDPAQYVETSPARTSIKNSPAAAADMVRRAQGAAGGGGRIDSYIIDNEPDLWSDTHRDVRRNGNDPNYTTYQELADTTKTYISAIRSVDANAKIAGPAISGYNFLLFSPKDVMTGSNGDFQANGSVEFLKWYLQQMKNSPTKTIDVVDVHHYPAQQDGVGALYPKGNLDDKTFSARINSVRALWDPSYSDDNYIGKNALGAKYAQPKLIPRIRGWINDVYGSPTALGVSIGEWNFGQEDHMSGAIATAEALGVFGRERLDSAYYWTVPVERSPSYWAFRAFTNYDGQGSRFGSFGVPAKTKGGPTAPLSVFAGASDSRSNSSGEVTAVLINKSATSRLSANLTLEGCGAMKSYRTYTYDGSSTQGFAASTPKALGKASKKTVIAVQLAPWSITVVRMSR